MGYPVRRIGHAGGQKIAGVALPVEAHHHFSIKIHPPAERRARRQAHYRRYRVNAKPAHAVFQLQGEGFNPDPDVRYPAPVQARTGDRVIVNGLPGNERIGMTPGQRQQFGNVFDSVLAVSVHLNGVGEAAIGTGFQPLHHRRAFAAVFGEAQQRDLRTIRRQRFKRAARGFIAAVVHHQTGQIERRQARQHRSHHRPVVVARDQHAGTEGY